MEPVVAIPLFPDPTVTNETPTAWDHVTVAPDGQTLTVYFVSGAEACYGLKSVTVTPAADGAPPTISLLTGLRADAANKRCMELAVLYSTVVVLDVPILGGGSPGWETGQPVETAFDATLVEPDPLVQDANPRTWEQVTIAADGRTTTVVFYDGVAECYGLSRVDVTAADGLTTIAPVTGVKPTPVGTACIEIAVLNATIVVLDAPVLGGGLV
jgi:hypothetical protein